MPIRNQAFDMIDTISKQIDQYSQNQYNIAFQSQSRFNYNMQMTQRMGGTSTFNPMSRTNQLGADCM